MLVQIQFRTDTLADWTAANPVLAKGEPAYEEDTGRLRIGNGVDHYLDLPVQSVDLTTLQALSDAAVQAAADAAQSAADAAASSGGGSAASETVIGVVELATAAETLAGTDNTRAVHPAGLAAALAALPATADASTTTKGIVELATNAEALAGTDAVRAVTPAALAAVVATLGGSTPDATTSVKGIVELATTAETTTGTDTVRAVTPAGVAAALAALASATTAARGLVELATNAETTTGTDATRAVTPAGLAAALAAMPSGIDHYSDIQALPGYPSTFAPAAHDHDSRYYSETEVNALIAGLQSQITALQTQAAMKSGGLTQFADVSDTAAASDGQALVFSGETGQYEAVALEERFAPVDPSTGRLRESAYPEYMAQHVVLNPGDPVPADLPAQALVWERDTPAPTLGWESIGSAVTGAASANNVQITTTEDLAVGDELIVAIGANGAATAPATFTVSPNAGAVGTPTVVGPQVQAGTVMSAIWRATVTTLIPAGSVLTVTARDASNNPVSRSSLMARAIKGTGLAASSRFDQSGVNGQGASGTYTVSSGGATAQASELLIGAFVHNASGITDTPGPGLEMVGSTLVSGDTTTPRALTVVARLLTSTGTATATATATGGTPVYSAALATFRAA